MKNPCKNTSLFFFLSLLLTISSRPTVGLGHEAEDENEYDYDTGSIWGPDQWGNLREEWATCNNGVTQSPIDILNRQTKIVPGSGGLYIKYKPSYATLVNRGHNIMVEWSGDAGYVRINDAHYKLVQSHWHSPSEHTIDGKRFALEQHLVHQRTDPILGNVTAVIGILYNIGRPQAFLSELEGAIEFVTYGESQINIGLVNPRDIKVDNKDYYRYMGSLTTPPCTENVIWTVSKWQDNSRPLQLLNGRKIVFYKSRPYEEYTDILIDTMK